MKEQLASGSRRNGTRMFDLKSIIDSPIPPVDPLDLQNFWALQSRHSDKPGVAYATSAILSACKNPAADPLALFARTTFIHILLQHGFLDKWRAGSEMQKVVFDAVAAYPLPNGLQQADPNGLIIALTA